MNNDEKKSIKKEIEKRIEETKKSIASLREQAKPVAPDRAIGRITRMDAIQQKSMSESNLRAAEEALFKLEEALSKIDEENFGVCAKCKGKIPLERVLIVPESPFCVACVRG